MKITTNLLKECGAFEELTQWVADNFPDGGEHLHVLDTLDTLKHSHGYQVWLLESLQLDGVGREWHTNGQLETEATYLFGEIDGVFRRWYDTGELRYEAFYHDGKFESVNKFERLK